MKEQAEHIVDAMKAIDLPRLNFISPMKIYSEVPGEKYVPVLTPYRDSTAVIESSKPDYTLLRPGWFTDEQEVHYELTHKGEPFVGHDVPLNCISYLIVKVATTPGPHVRQSLGITHR